MSPRPKRILITAGGTGGHIYPAQALAQQFSQLEKAPEVLFAAGGLATSRFFDQKQFAFSEVSCSALSKNPFKLMRSAFKMLKGIYQSLKLIKHYQPDVVVGFGSYYTIPILVAAKLKKIPIILHEANSIPGKANKWFAPFVEHVGVHFPSTGSLLKGKSVEVGMPLRAGYSRASIDKQTALDYFQLSNQFLTLLIVGGSQGAQSINQLLKEALPFLCELPLQFIHLTGAGENVSVLIDSYKKSNLNACVRPFEINMQFAWKAADLFLGRAGASTIGEAMEFEVPGILIPYPFAADRHQDKNADFFVDHVGGGVKFSQNELQVKQLLEALRAISSEKSLTAKREAIRTYKKRPRLDLCQLVLKTIR